MRTYWCSCQGNILCETNPTIRLLDFGKKPANHPFEFESGNLQDTLFGSHFYPLTERTIGLSLPNIVKSKISAILHMDPFAYPSDVLKQLFECDDVTTDESNISIPQWIRDTIVGKGNRSADDLLAFIHVQCTALIQQMENQDSTSDTPAYQLLHGSSIQSAIHFSSTNRYTRFMRRLPGAPPFNTLKDFLTTCHFPSPETILCVPVSPELFQGTNYPADKIEIASSCILFTSPTLHTFGHFMR
jgi:hypothetical protein